MDRHPYTLSARAAVAFIVALWLAVVFMRFTGPTDLMENAQDRPVGYVMDVLRHGQWFVQHDYRGEIMSKPPLYTWVVTLLSMPQDRISKLSLYLPCAASILAAALMIRSAGARRFGAVAGFLGALTFLASALPIKHVSLARTDALFTCAVLLGALLAHRAWTRGNGWTLFWLAAAAATLTKGPLGILIGLFGLLAAFWERRSGTAAPIRGSHVLGVALFCLIVLGWAVPAFVQAGRPLIDRMLGHELIGHLAGGSGHHHTFGEGLPRPTIYFLFRFMPWCVATLAGLWRVWWRPAADVDVRRFERFVFCWFVAGLALFTVSAKQRPDHLLPILPAAALLAGRELARLLAARPTRQQWSLVTAAVVITFSAWSVYYHVVRAEKQNIRHSVGLQRLAVRIERELKDGPPLMHVDGSPLLQAYLNTMWPPVSYEVAADLLDSQAAAMVTVRSPQRLRDRMRDPSKLVELMRWPEAAGKPLVVVMANADPSEARRHAATIIGSLRLELFGARLSGSHRGVLVFEATEADARITMVNRSESAQVVRTRVRSGGMPWVSQNTSLVSGGKTTFEF